MIDNRFLEYKLESAFVDDLRRGNISNDSIVYVEDGTTVLPYNPQTEERCKQSFIYTHGTYYYGFTKERVIKLFELLEAANLPVRKYEDEEDVDTYEIKSGDTIQQAIKKLDSAEKELFSKLLFTDDEDISQTENSVLRLSDFAASAMRFHQYGYKILRKNIVNQRNILTSSMFESTNTIYEIKYDFDLNGATIKLPQNCALYFRGGLLQNGTVDGNRGYIFGFASPQILDYVKFTNIFNLDRTQFGSQRYGSTELMPLNEINGYTFYNTTLKKFCIYDSNRKTWVDVNGNPYNFTHYGNIADTIAGDVNVGYLYHDNSGSWVNRANKSKNRWMVRNEQGEWDVLASTDTVTVELDGLMSAADKIWLSGAEGLDKEDSAKYRLNTVEEELLALRQDFIEGKSFLSNSGFAEYLRDWVVNYPTLDTEKRLRSSNKPWEDADVEYRFQIISIDDFDNGLITDDEKWSPLKLKVTDEYQRLVYQKRTLNKSTNIWGEWTPVKPYKEPSEIIRRSQEFFTVGLNSAGKIGNFFISFGSKADMYGILSDYHGESYTIKKEGRYCMCIHNNFITQLERNYLTSYRMEMTQHKTYAPIACTLELFYYAETRGKLQIYFDGEQERCAYDNVLPYEKLNYTATLNADNAWHKLELNYLWNGYGDFTIKYSGKIYIHTIITKKDELKTIDNKYGEVQKRVQGATMRFYGFDDTDAEILKSQIADTRLLTDVKVNSVIYSTNLKCFIGVYDYDGKHYCNNWNDVDMYNTVTYINGTATYNVNQNKLFIFNDKIYLYDPYKGNLVRYNSDSNDHFINVEEEGFFVCDASGNVAFKVSADGDIYVNDMYYKGTHRIQ